MAVALLIVYGVLLTFILVFSLGQLQLTWAYLRQRKRAPEPMPPLPDTLPLVTIQLPIYNERYVVERLIDAVCRMDWPRDRLEVQVLDDSDDETTALARDRIKEWRAKGADVHLVRRADRTGYKAGALAHGLERAKGTFIAVFDSDFLPGPDLLKRTIPWFRDPKLGMVQTRWGHLNRRSNLLTRLQAFGLDAHFTIEQVGRNTLGHFINFNGTGGVWRRQAIEEAGGWRPDTLTEDLDLSYRAQLKGWRFKYLEMVECPAELPSQMNALKAQQRRWNKGAAECVRLNLPAVLRRGDIGWGTKLHAALHLMNSTIFVCILLLALLSVPLLWVKQGHPELDLLFDIAVIFTFSLVVLLVFYAVSQNARREIGPWAFLWTFPVFLSVSMGLALHNAIAVVEGYLGIRSGFVRTPKLGLIGKDRGMRRDRYMKSVISPVTFLEGLLFAYFLGALWLGWKVEDGGLWLFHGMLALGYGAVFYYSVVHSIRTRS